MPSLTRSLALGALLTTLAAASPVALAAPQITQKPGQTNPGWNSGSSTGTTTTTSTTTGSDQTDNTPASFIVQTMRIDVNPVASSFNQTIWTEFKHASCDVICRVIWAENTMSPFPDTTTLPMECNNPDYKMTATQVGPLRGQVGGKWPDKTSNNFALSVQYKNQPAVASGQIQAFDPTYWVWNFDAAGDPNFTTQLKAGCTMPFGSTPPRC